MKTLGVLVLLFLFCSTSHAENICSSTTSSATSGTLYDSGGASSNYSNDDDCGFLIQPTSSGSITLTFSQFDLESGYDYLYVYDGTNTSGTLLGQFTGTSSPGTLTATSGSMYIRFDSDFSIIRSGFTASWTSSNISLICDIAEDNFSTPSYGNNDGTLNFSGNWDEYEGTSASIPEASANPASGHIRIVGGQLVLNNYSPETQNFPGVERELDLSAFSSATFTFDFVTSGGVDLADSLVVMASANGGTNWTVLEDIRNINNMSGSKSYNLTPYISSNTKIRLRFNNETVSGLGAACCYGASPETFSVDNVQINACVTSGGGGGDTAASAFNCVENGSDGITGKLYTKAVNQNFSFDIIALQDASTIETSFANGADHTVTVELVDASSGSCSTYSSLSPVISQDVIFSASDAGNKSSASMSSSTAYSNVRCRMTDSTNSPAVVGCSTDAFAIRPTNFSITSNLTNSSSTGTPIAKAGDNFTLTATASSGYNGTPKIDTSKVEAHSGAVQTGTVSGTFGSANSSNGQASGTAFTYSEVGSLRFAAQGIYDDTFTAIDQSDDCTNDFSDTPVSGKIGCKFGNSSSSNYFGRFTPDHFDVTLNSPEFSSACGNFSYIGQPVKYATRPIVTVTAKNSSGTTTQNYTGSFLKINPAHGTYGIIPSYTEAIHALSVLDANSPALTDNSNGSGALTFADTSSNILGITRGNPETSFDAEIAMSFNLSDTDGIVVANVDGSPKTNPISFGAASAGNGISFDSSKAQRWGRITLTNAHGSELSVLPVSIQTGYFNGTDFIPNSDDNCTTINLSSQISLSNPGTSSGASQTGNTAMTIGSGSSSASLLNNPLSGGTNRLNFSAPGSGNTGYIDIGSNFSSSPWLLFDWDNDSSHDNSPSGKATFGIYSGNPEQIYFREVY